MINVLNLTEQKEAVGCAIPSHGEGKVGVSRTMQRNVFNRTFRLHDGETPPAAAQATTPLPAGGSFDGYFHISNTKVSSLNIQDAKSAIFRTQKRQD